MSWTDERIATLQKMWEGGSTASQIAEELGGVSRNAVIGKAHRLGLKARPSPVKASEKKKAAAAKKPMAKAAPKKAAPKTAAPKPAPAAKPTSAGQTASASNANVQSQPVPNPTPNLPKIVSVGPGGFLRQGPGDQQPPIPPAPRAAWFRPSLAPRSPIRRACSICPTKCVVGLWAIPAKLISTSADQM